ncbi:fucose isomerase [Gallibacterium salpingitidis]|uniref:Fucose isomerase n=1 Tax=Gallibacterium salpingitidis TaxID=505341 RepID=A0AB36E3W3_9PAST|nr:L-fucose mutarotase [Gallibacterium salpingitidis]OBX11329.1 fucose isomerase [Gallibacterium salpingitidis]WKS99233.1 L-fucose mutarotase [Gallibacterium salpingitidis]
MLKGIHPAISPTLLKVLAEMGHGDELVLADAHFPGHQLHHQVLRADGVDIATLLEGISQLIELDQYVDTPLIMMQVVEGDTLDPSVEKRYVSAIQQNITEKLNLTRIDRFSFYERAKQAFAVVITGETAKYGNIIIKKGVTPVKD